MKHKCPLAPRPEWCSEQCKKICKDDPQKIRLYCFEESLVDHLNDRKTITLEKCKELTKAVCDFYNVPMPEVKDGRGLKSARGGYNSKMKLNIKLPKEYRYPLAVLHEVAHCVMQYNIRNETKIYQHHGALYMKYLIEIYSRFLNIPETALKTAANAFQLDYHP